MAVPDSICSQRSVGLSRVSAVFPRTSCVYTVPFFLLWWCNSRFSSTEIGRVAAGMASGVKISWVAWQGLLLLSSVWLLVQLVVVQWDMWVRGDQWFTKGITKSRIKWLLRKCGFLLSGSSFFFSHFPRVLLGISEASERRWECLCRIWEQEWCCIGLMFLRVRVLILAHPGCPG